MTDSEKELRRLAKTIIESGVTPWPEDIRRLQDMLWPKDVLALLDRIEALERQTEADWNACCDAMIWAHRFAKDLPPPQRAVVALVEALQKARGGSP